MQTNIDNIRSVFVFDGVIREAIHELKYRNLQAIAPYLAEYMAEYYKNHGLSGEVLLAVPLHTNRLRNRGYNQSELLADKISELINLPVLHNVLLRIKDSNPQAKTSNVDIRRQNVLNAFHCYTEEVMEKEVILIDDVCTSGATLEACAQALKKAGTKKVIGFTLAREI
jgi:ComF family protein